MNFQEEEQSEEINNIIIDKTEEEKVSQKNKSLKKEEIYIDNEDEASVEGELEDLYQNIDTKKKTKYKVTPYNEYLDLLLNFVMSDKHELNYVLSGYFVNVLISLLNNYPYKIIKYLYTQRRDALKKIIFHSNQKAFAILSVKLLNLESYIKVSVTSKEPMAELIEENIPFRNELIKEIVNSINLEGIKGEYGVDVEAIFALISDLINDNSVLAKELIFNDYLCPHFFDVLDTDLYANIDNNKADFNEDNFNMKYNIYGLFINLASKLLKIIISNYFTLLPMDFNFNNLHKNKSELHFNDNMIISFGKILKNNFLAKKPALILEKNSSIIYEGLGALNLHILELVINMFFFMKALPGQFDRLLCFNLFCQRSVEFFFKYQWNDIYRNKFIEFFNLYLEDEERHKELTNYFFNNMKLQNLIINFLDEKKNENDKILQNIKFEFKSGKKIKSGIYPHVIDLAYKIQAYTEDKIFTEFEKTQFNIINLGEFEFSKDEKSNKFLKKINISNNLKGILSKDEKWSTTFNNKVLPVIRKYEGQLCKKARCLDDEDSDTKEDFGSNNLLLKQMLNVLKKNTPIKRFSLPISRNDKNSSMNPLNRNKSEKSSIREKLLSQGYKSRHILDDDDEDENGKENTDTNSISDTKEKNESESGSVDKGDNSSDKYKMYNDINYWESKNDLPENVRKEVDKKTNIIFNYNPITGENESKNEISEEDELLSIAMGLEQEEKMEKNKKIMYIMPGKLKPINLKTKSNPVQNLFINIKNNNNKYNKVEKFKHKKGDIVNFFDNENDNKENDENEKEEEGIIKKEEDKKDDKNDEINKEEENKNTKDNNVDIKDEDKSKMFNDVNYWKSNENYLNEEEVKDLLNNL